MIQVKDPRERSKRKIQAKNQSKRSNRKMETNDPSERSKRKIQTTILTLKFLSQGFQAKVPNNPILVRLGSSRLTATSRWLAATIHWTPTRHHRRCGQSCPCCRAEHAEIIGSCEACNDLWQMKCVCTRFKILLQAYGRQC